MSETKKNTCLVVVGELSGEEHSQSFFKELQAQCPDTHFYGVGGDYLESQGLEVLYHLKNFSSWGINEVLKKISLYLNALKHLEKEVVKRNTTKAILVDYQTFNLKLALRLKKLDVDVLYYVAPQAWAWKAWRAPLIAKAVHTLFCILPFERKWFKERGVKEVISIAHPLFRKHQVALSQNMKKRESIKKILLLPGSRKNEIKFLYPQFLRVAKKLKQEYGVEIGLVKATSLPDEYFRAGDDIVDHFYEAKDLETALVDHDMAFAASGTVTLSCALFSLPTIVCYGASLLEEFIFKQFVNYKGDIALGNIIHQKRILPELLGDRVNTNELFKQASKWLNDQAHYLDTVNELDKTQSLVKGDSINIAQYMADVINNGKTQ